MSHRPILCHPDYRLVLFPLIEVIPLDDVSATHGFFLVLWLPFFSPLRSGISFWRIWLLGVVVYLEEFPPLYFPLISLSLASEEKEMVQKGMVGRGG